MKYRGPSPVVLTINRHKTRKDAKKPSQQVFTFEVNTPGASKPTTNRKRYTRSNDAVRMGRNHCGAKWQFSPLQNCMIWGVEIKGKLHPVSVVRNYKNKR